MPRDVRVMRRTVRQVPGGMGSEPNYHYEIDLELVPIGPWYPAAEPTADAELTVCNSLPTRTGSGTTTFVYVPGETVTYRVTNPDHELCAYVDALTIGTTVGSFVYASHDQSGTPESVPPTWPLYLSGTFVVNLGDAGFATFVVVTDGYAAPCSPPFDNDCWMLELWHGAVDLDPHFASSVSNTTSPSGNYKVVTGLSETVLAGCDLTISGSPVRMRWSTTISQNRNGVVKQATMRLRRTNTSGTILASKVIGDSGDSTSGNQASWSSYFLDSAPTDGHYVLTVQETAGDASTEIWSALRTFELQA